jgi:hypothetical protein
VALLLSRYRHRFDVQRMLYASRLGNLILLPTIAQAGAALPIADADYDVKAAYYRCVCL